MYKFMCFNKPYSWLFLISLLLMLLSRPALSYENMVFGVPNFAPYTHKENDKITGLAVKPVTQVLDTMGVSYTLRMFDNFSLLFKALRRNEVQGLFLASKNIERDRIAVFSKPVMINNWVWFQTIPPSFRVSSKRFKQNAKIATIEKTNTFRWLSRQGFQAHGTQAHLLPRLLMDKKVDSVFSAQVVFERHAQQQNIHMRSYMKTIESKKPFGIYINKRYLLKNEGFMEALNALIKTQ